MNQNQTRHGLLALSPIIVLLFVYLVGSVIAGDFYRIPIAVAFLLASVYAIAIAMLWLYCCLSILLYGGALNKYLTDAGRKNVSEP